MGIPPAVSVVMPAHNEEGYLTEGVSAVVAGLRQRGRSFEVLVVQNGSTDRTDAEAAELVQAHEEVRALSLPDPDYGLALRAGFLAATGETVVNFDVDYYDLDFMDRALATIERDGHAIVVGSKRGEGANDTRAASRRLVTLVFSSILRVGFGLGVSDTHGVKAMRRLPLLPIVEECRFGTDLFDTELVLRAQRAGLAISEIPVVVKELRPARTPIWKRIPRSIVGLVRLRVALSRPGR